MRTKAAIREIRDEQWKESIRTRLIKVRSDLQEKLEAAEPALQRTLQIEEKLSTDNGVADPNDSITFLSKDVSTLRKSLEKVENALQAIEQGIYGFCENENCGRPIEPERLAVQPFTIYCCACKKSIEHREAKINGRKRYRPF